MRVVLMAVVLLAALPALTRAAATESRTFVSGGDLPGEFRMAAADEADFYRRLNVPPRLEWPPEPLPAGRAYVVRSPYWPEVLPGREGLRGRASETATYYPDGGYVKARQPDLVNGGEMDSWLVLDLRQRAILERYIRLGAAGAIPREPGVLEVLGADAAAGAAIGVQVASTTLTGERAAQFWQALAGVRPSAEPAAGAGQQYVILTLPEGRDVRLRLAGSPSQPVLVDEAGGQVYQLRDAAARALVGSPAPSSLAVPQDEGAGSPLWWFLAGGGAALLLAAAAYLARKWAAPPAARETPGSAAG